MGSFVFWGVGFWALGTGARKASSSILGGCFSIKIFPRIFADFCVIGWGFPSGTSGKELTCQCRKCKRHWFDLWVRKIPWRRARQPRQYSCLENPMDTGAWRVTVHGVVWTGTGLEQHSTHSHETGWGFRGTLRFVGTHRVGTGLIRVCREAWSSVLKTWLVSRIVGTKYHRLRGLK